VIGDGDETNALGDALIEEGVVVRVLTVEEVLGR
jgi:hypothetical protein